MDAGGLVSGDEGVAVPLVVVAVRVAVKQIRKNIAQRGVAIDMVVGGPGSENNARATVVDGLVVVQVVVAGGGSAKYPPRLFMEKMLLLTCVFVMAMASCNPTPRLLRHVTFSTWESLTRRKIMPR